jgi:hypothetical protein
MLFRNVAGRIFETERNAAASGGNISLSLLILPSTCLAGRSGLAMAAIHH